MPSTYSDDLCRSIVGFVLQGPSRRKAARVFGVSASFVIELMRWHREGLPYSQARGGARHIKLVPYLNDLVGWIEAAPDITLSEMAERLFASHGVSASEGGLSKLLRRSGYTYKKIPAGERSHAWQTSPAAA